MEHFIFVSCEWVSHSLLV